jgi:hypothetical protein
VFAKEQDRLRNEEAVLKKQIIEHKHELTKLQELVATTSEVPAGLASHMRIPDAVTLIRSGVNYNQR